MSEDTLVPFSKRYQQHTVNSHKLPTRKFVMLVELSTEVIPMRGD